MHAWKPNTLNPTDPIDHEIRQWLPHFYGIEQIKQKNGESTIEEYLVLEDITKARLYKLEK